MSSTRGEGQSPTVEYRLHTGEHVLVHRACALVKRIDAKDDAVEHAADRLVPFRKAHLRARNTFRAFLSAHGKALKPADYRKYQRLRAAYELTLQRYNSKIDQFNAVVRTYNAAVYACRT
jgi:hypothetical protein